MIPPVLQQLLDIVLCTMKGVPYEKPLQEGDKIFELAKNNALSGMIFSSLSPKYVEQEIITKFRQDFYVYHAQDVLQNKEVFQINEAMNHNGVDHLFFKGTFLKKLYPESYMRSMGDIDMLIRPEMMMEVHQILNDLGYHLETSGPNHDLFKKTEQLIVEVHPQLSANIDFDHEAIFRIPFNESTLLKNHEYELNPEYHLAFLIYHMAKHFRSSTVGLRHLVDIVIFVRYYQNRINATLFFEFMSKTGLVNFSKNIFLLIHNYFKCDEIVPLIKNFSQEISLVELLLQHVAKSGVNWRGESNYMLGGVISETKDDRTLANAQITYIFKIIFPSPKGLSKRYKYLEKQPWLYPFAWLNRFFRLVTKKPRSTFHKLMQAATVRKQVDFFKKVGLWVDKK